MIAGEGPAGGATPQRPAVLAAPRVLAVEGFTPTLGALALTGRTGLPTASHDDARICFALPLDDASPAAPTWPAGSGWLAFPVARLAPGEPLPRSADPRWADHAFVQAVPDARPGDWNLTMRRDALRQAAHRQAAASSPDSGFAARLAAALANYERVETHWKLRGRDLLLRRDRPLVMAVVNVTPDSFSDGGQFLAPAEAVTQALALVEAGAALLDVGGESTRPGSLPVTTEVELERVIPVIEALARRVAVPIAIDTTKADVARAALDAGASIVNDTSALSGDPALGPLVARTGAGLVLMHRFGPPRTMQEEPHYVSCSSEVAAHLHRRVDVARQAGVRDDQLLLDPGIGFGKRLVDNLDLIATIGSLRSVGFPVLLGASRKSFLGILTGRVVGKRDAATLATTAAAFCAGAEVVRVHDAAGSADVIRVLHALISPPADPPARSAS